MLVRLQPLWRHCIKFISDSSDISPVHYKLAELGDKKFGLVCDIRLIKRGAGLCRRNFFSCWLRVTMTRNSDIVPFRRDVWAYHVTCDRNFLWCIACPRRPDTKTLGRPCLVHGRLDSSNCHLYYRYPSTPTRDLYPEMFLSSNQLLGPCFPIALHQCKRE